MTNSAAASPALTSKANTPQLVHESSNSKTNKGQRNSGSGEVNQNETRSSSRVATAAATPNLNSATPIIPSGASSRKPSAGRS